MQAFNILSGLPKVFANLFQVFFMSSGFLKNKFFDLFLVQNLAQVNKTVLNSITILKRDCKATLKGFFMKKILVFKIFLIFMIDFQHLIEFFYFTCKNSLKLQIFRFFSNCSKLQIFLIFLNSRFFQTFPVFQVLQQPCFIQYGVATL